MTKQQYRSFCLEWLVLGRCPIEHDPLHEEMTSTSPEENCPGAGSATPCELRSGGGCAGIIERRYSDDPNKKAV